MNVYKLFRGNIIILDNLESFCFRCQQKRTIIDYKWSVTKNNRKLCKGKCIECGGNIALMSGYATLPDSIYTTGSGVRRKHNVTKE